MTKVFVDALSVFAAAAIGADGNVAIEEKAVCKDICSDLDINWSDFEPLLDKKVKEISKLKEEELDKFLIDASKKLNDDEANILFEASLNLILADKVLTFEECETISAISEILEIPNEVVIARIAFAVQEDDIKVDVEDALGEL